MNILEITFLENNLRTWAAAWGTAFLVLMVLLILKPRVARGMAAFFRGIKEETGQLAEGVIRIRSLSGEQLIMPNSDLLQSRIRNYKHMQERRVPFSIGVVYETPGDTLKRIPGILKEIIESQEMTRFERAHFKD